MWDSIVSSQDGERNLWEFLVLLWFQQNIETSLIYKTSYFSAVYRHFKYMLGLVKYFIL